VRMQRNTEKAKLIKFNSKLIPFFEKP